jgi:sec-independent protein translocase protein TatB
MDFSLFGIGFPQLMLIFVIGLIVFGPERLPGMARQAGRMINELRKLTQDARGEIQSLTKELDIRDDLNSVKNDLLNIRNDLASTAAGVTRDFESIRKDVTLKNDAGNTMGAQREQYTYKVSDAPNADGSDAVRVEETITRETIIQDAIEDTPATATETITDVSSGEAAPTLESANAVPALQDQALRVIHPARPMDAPVTEVQVLRTILPARPMDVPVMEAEPGDLTATETITLTTEDVVPVKSNAGVPLLEIEPSRAANPFAVPYDLPEPAPVEAVPAPEYALAGAGSAPSDWSESLEKTRQEFNERMDKMEGQFMERLDRVEKLLASQFLRAHQD